MQTPTRALLRPARRGSVVRAAECFGNHASGITPVQNIYVLSLIQNLWPGFVAIVGLLHASGRPDEAQDHLLIVAGEAQARAGYGANRLIRQDLHGPAIDDRQDREDSATSENSPYRNCPKSPHRPRTEVSRVDKAGPRSPISLPEATRMQAPQTALVPFRTVSRR